MFVDRFFYAMLTHKIRMCYMTKLSTKVRMPKSISLANTPTRIEKLENISKDFNGINLYIKRDDFTGVEMSGNKVRKLEFLVNEAVDKGCDCLITCGGIQSNHARATATAASKFGMKSYLVLKGSESDDKNGNYFLDMLLGAEIKLITSDEYKNNRQEIMESIKSELMEKGLKPYIIPEGASNGLGNFGYMKAFEEILEQEKTLGIEFDAIVVAVGSGSTYGGLLLGSSISNSGKRIIGVNIYDDKVDFHKKVYDLMLESQSYHDVRSIIKKDDIEILDDYVGNGYAKSREEELKFIKYFAKKEGIILDSVYTGKAFYGLYNELREENIMGVKNILFIHTGGIFGMFSKNSLFYK